MLSDYTFMNMCRIGKCWHSPTGSRARNPSPIRADGKTPTDLIGSEFYPKDLILLHIIVFYTTPADITFKSYIYIHFNIPPWY